MNERHEKIKRVLARVALICIVLVYVYCAFCVLSGRINPSDALLILVAGTLGFPILAWLFLFVFSVIFNRHKDAREEQEKNR